MNAGHDCFGSTCRGTDARYDCRRIRTDTRGQLRHERLMAEARITTHPHAALAFINIYRSKHCVQPAGTLIDSEAACCWPSALGKNERHTLLPCRICPLREQHENASNRLVWAYRGRHEDTYACLFVPRAPRYIHSIGEFGAGHMVLVWSSRLSARLQAPPVIIPKHITAMRVTSPVCISHLSLPSPSM